MDTKLQQLLNVLIELRSASMNSTENTIRDTMKKYDMLFLGEKFNCIYSIELFHSLKNYFHFSFSNDELIELIPIACKTLQMKYEKLVQLDKSSNTSYCYQIHLW